MKFSVFHLAFAVMVLLIGCCAGCGSSAPAEDFANQAAIDLALAMQIPDAAPLPVPVVPVGQTLTADVTAIVADAPAPVPSACASGQCGIRRDTVANLTTPCITQQAQQTRSWQITRRGFLFRWRR